MSCEDISVNVLASKRLQAKKKGQDRKSCPLAEAVGVGASGKLWSRLLVCLKGGSLINSNGAKNVPLARFLHYVCNN